MKRLKASFVSRFFPHAVILGSCEDVNIHSLLFMHGKSNKNAGKSHKQTHVWILYNLVLLFFTVYDLNLNRYGNSFILAPDTLL